jgi:hypothetical protein
MSYRSLPDRPATADGVRLEGPIRAGDWVTTGANVAPHYEVIAVCDDKAWIRDVHSGHDGITSLSRCHKVDGPAAAGRPH